ncbi:hypothetical protein ABVT39_002425 [Epinephelus coioides]
MRRYRLTEVCIIYVDRDCCNQDSESKTAALFLLVGHLDIWHRFASGVTTESHELYPTFMRQLSHCIFEVDLGDAYCLTEMKRSKLAGKRRMVGLTEAKIIRRISREEWRLHCRRRPCGTVESALLIQDLLNTFGKPAESMMEFPLLNALRIQHIVTSSPAPPQPQPRPSSSSLRKRRTTALSGFYPVISSSYNSENVKDDSIQEEEGGCRAGAATGEQNSPGDVAVCLQEVWPAQKTRDRPHSDIWGDLLHVGRRKIETTGGQALYRAKKPGEVDAEVWAHVHSEGGDTTNTTLAQSLWKVQFGRYQVKTFHRLLQNDVGYAVSLVASHQKKRERTESQSPLMSNKVESFSLIHTIQFRASNFNLPL